MNDWDLATEDAYVNILEINMDCSRSTATSRSSLEYDLLQIVSTLSQLSSAALKGASSLNYLSTFVKSSSIYSRI